ncbi:MAG: hypothetical protein ACOX6T_10815 [Myxococcales bacterium]|jgi:hypothetical protein
MTNLGWKRLAILVSALALCNCPEIPNDEGVPGENGGPPDIVRPDGGSGADGGSSEGGDGGDWSGTIAVNCTGPTQAVPVNTPIEITCTVSSGGRSLGAPVITAEPAGGVVLNEGVQSGVFVFSLNTGAPGYYHPLSFADTTVRVTYEVRDSADPSQFGRDSVDIEVLGNYWLGDSGANGQGIFALASDGTYLGQAVGPLGIQGVSDIQLLPGGDIIVSSHSLKTIRIFNRQGVQQQPFAFDSVDPYTNKTIWEAQYASPNPQQMALSSRGELWVAGAYEDEVWGIAVFNPRTGKLLRFVPHQLPSYNAFKFTSICRRSDGLIMASANDWRTICMYDENTYEPRGCPAVEHSYFTAHFASFLPLPDATVIVGTFSTSGSGLIRLSPTLGVLQESPEISEYTDIRAMVLSGNEIVALDNSGSTVGNVRLSRFDLTTLEALGSSRRVDKTYNPAGLVRLTRIE